MSKDGGGGLVQSAGAAEPNPLLCCAWEPPSEASQFCFRLAGPAAYGMGQRPILQPLPPPSWGGEALWLPTYLPGQEEQKAAQRR